MTYINVSTNLDDGSVVGKITAERLMTTNYGSIVDVSGDLIRFDKGLDVYNWQVYVASGTVGMQYNWPITSGYQIGHGVYGAAFENGVPQALWDSGVFANGQLIPLTKDIG